MRLVEADPSHIPFLAEHMRYFDQIECLAFGHGPEDALSYALRSSLWALTAIVDDAPHAMMGVTSASMIEGIGEPWMLGTERIYDHARDLVRFGPAILAEMQATFSQLRGGVSETNDRAIRFLRFLGFECCDEPINVGGFPFLYFCKGEPVGV